MQSCNNSEINNNSIVLVQSVCTDNVPMMMDNTVVLDNTLATDHFEVYKEENIDQAVAVSLDNVIYEEDNCGKMGTQWHSLGSVENIAGRTSDIHHIARLLG
jgi:hypothetical protein